MPDDRVEVIRQAWITATSEPCSWWDNGRCGLGEADRERACWCWAKAVAVDAALPSTVDLPALLRAHDARVTGLLEANNREVGRRRAAEARVRELEAALLRAQHPLYITPSYGPIKAVRGVATTAGPGSFDLMSIPRNLVEEVNALAEDRAEWDAAPRW